MATVLEYKTFAAECLLWATESGLDEEKELFLQMARDWTVAAIQLEAGQLPEKTRDSLLHSK